MAIAQDNSGKGISASQAAGVAFTFSYTVNSNSNGIITISVYTGDNAGSNHQYPSAVSYNGVACTVVAGSKVTTAGIGTSSIWYLVAPATGSNTVSVTVPTTGSGSGASRIAAFVDSFTGASQIGQGDGITNTAAGSTTLSLTTNTIVDNSWSVGIFVSNQVAAPTASSGVTIRQSDTTLGNGSAMGDSNAAVTPVGSKTMTATGSSGSWIGSMLVIKPYTGKAFQVDSGSTLTSGLLAYYKLEDATDYYSTKDLTNTGTCAFNAAKVNNGVDSGSSPSNKYLTISNDLGITGGAISVSCWAKHTAAYGANAQQALFYQADSSTFVGYMAVFGTDGSSAGRVGFCRVRQGIAEDFLYSSQTINTSTFYHLVLTYDGTTLKGYFNGSEVVSSARSGSGSSNASDKFEIMKQTDNGGLYQFEGLVDEVGVWNRALTTTEITDLYNAGSGQTMVIPTANTFDAISLGAAF